MNAVQSTATDVFNDDLPTIIESISADVDNMPGGTADFTPAATATPCAVAVSIAIMC